MALGELIEEGEPPAGLAGVEAGERVVQEQDVRLEGQGAGKTGALLPAAPESARETVSPGLEFQGRHEFGHGGGSLGLAQIPVVAQGERDVLQDGEVIEEVAVLEDQA